MMLPCITGVLHLNEKTVIIRAGLNTPLDESGVILDDFRLLRFLPTLHYLLEQDAQVVIVSHIGREKTDTLEPIAKYLSKHTEIDFRQNFFTDDAKIDKHIDALRDELAEHIAGRVILLDNVRQTSREKDGDVELASKLSSLADVYVNEAFSVSHREHMSMVELPRHTQASVTGIACNEEVEQLSLALDPPNKSIAVISGNKFATKLPLITRFVQDYSTIVIGGALANTMYHLAGYEVGKSLYEHDLSPESRSELLELLDNDKIYLPRIVVCATPNGEKIAKDIEEVGAEDIIYDIASEGLFELEEVVEQARLVVWNGPLGYYEGGYTEGTARLLELVTASQSQSIIGGGNTVDAARDLGYEERITHLSTGGGAMIDFLTEGTLPALSVLK